MIQVSEETANLLKAGGKQDWVTPRESLVSAKGKGMIQTYWLIMKGSSSRERTSISGGSDSMNHDTSTLHPHVDPRRSPATKADSSSSSSSSRREDERIRRMVDWNVDVLHRQLKKIVAMRNSKSSLMNASSLAKLRNAIEEGKTVLDEVKEVIPLSTKANTYKRDPDTIELGPNVMSQLRDYVAAIAAMYPDNPFHSFEHASHVTQSVAKLLARVVTPDSIDYDSLCYTKAHQQESKLHEYTYGITSDPIIHFACTFSALIHDVDHPGVPNATLVQEQATIADVYNNKSIAEQHSVDLSWELLMEPRYSDLRACIYQNQDELDRFRQLIVNAVMATDIADKELGALRKNRWEKAFSDTCSQSSGSVPSDLEDINRKATIVIEHLIQASDVAHTMQHWHIYQKWNERLFHEMYKAYRAGRSEKNPADFWYDGEIGFFDFYIIPLARKLKECQVFGVSSDEYLNYATTNRQEWLAKGKRIVAEYLEKYEKEEDGNKGSNR